MKFSGYMQIQDFGSRIWEFGSRILDPRFLWEGAESEVLRMKVPRRSAMIFKDGYNCSYRSVPDSTCKIFKHENINFTHLV